MSDYFLRREETLRLNSFSACKIGNGACTITHVQDNSPFQIGQIIFAANNVNFFEASSKTISLLLSTTNVRDTVEVTYI